MTALDNIPADILALAREALAAQFECSVKAFPSSPARARRGEMDHTYEIRAICRAIMADRLASPVDTGREKALEEALDDSTSLLASYLHFPCELTAQANQQIFDNRRALANPENGRG